MGVFVVTDKIITLSERFLSAAEKGDAAETME